MDFNNFNTDTFFEQIVPIRKTGGNIAAVIGIWFLVVLLAIAALFFLGSFGMLIAFGIGYGGWWLSSKFNVEYEYIITNGTMDVDKITNKSSRKRILSFELSTVTRLEKLNPATLGNINSKELVTACNITDENAYLLSADKKTKGQVNLIFAPNPKIQSAVEKFAPKFITHNVFKK